MGDHFAGCRLGDLSVPVRWPPPACTSRHFTTASATFPSLNSCKDSCEARKESSGRTRFDPPAEGLLSGRGALARQLAALLALRVGAPRF